MSNPITPYVVQCEARISQLETQLAESREAVKARDRAIECLAKRANALSRLGVMYRLHTVNARTLELCGTSDSECAANPIASAALVAAKEKA